MPLEHAFDSLRIPAKSTRGQLMVDQSAVILKRFYFLLRELVKMQAGWLPTTASLEEKLHLAQSLWENALIAKELRERVLELRYPERSIQPDDDAFLLEWWKSFSHAPSGNHFLMTIHSGLKPFLHRLFQSYLDLSDHLDDSPTVRILKQALIDFDDQANRAEALSSLLACKQSQWVNEAQEALDSQQIDLWLALESPRPSEFNWHEEGRPFQIARRAGRDSQFPRPFFAWPDRLDPSRGAGKGMELQIRVAVHHLNEVWATEMAAAVLYDLLNEAPPEFLEDAARWCFDESRHCRMGYVRLREFGFDPSEIPVDSFSYDVGEQFDPIARLGVIFYFETTYIHTKSERVKIFANHGDQTSSHDIDYDWTDELIHTYYGNKWLKYFLEKRNDPRTPKQIKEVAKNGVEKMRRSASKKDHEETEYYYRRILDKALILSQS